MKTKIILSLVVVLIILICVTVYYSKDYVTLDTKNISKLNDPNLIYSSKYWEGLCANEKGEGGGCYSELYFYNNGKLITKSGFTNQKTGENSDSTIEKDLGVVTVNQFIKSMLNAKRKILKNLLLRNLIKHIRNIQLYLVPLRIIIN